MTTTWFVHCVTCAEDCPTPELNDGDEVMLSLIAHRRAIVGILPLLQANWGDIELSLGRSSVDVLWFEKHVGHELAAKSAHGEVKVRRDCRRCQQPQDHVYLLKIVNGGLVSGNHALCETCNRELAKFLFRKPDTSGAPEGAR